MQQTGPEERLQRCCPGFHRTNHAPSGSREMNRGYTRMGLEVAVGEEGKNEMGKGASGRETETEKLKTTTAKPNKPRNLKYHRGSFEGRRQRGRKSRGCYGQPHEVSSCWEISGSQTENTHQALN